MNQNWEILVEHLRAELESYGGLLQLFDEQQDNLLRGDSDAVLSYTHEIDAHVRVTAELRERREQSVRFFAEKHARQPDSTLRSLLPLFAEELRPLFSALIDEINHLIRRVRNGARRNHQLLSRALEVHQETLLMLRPAAFTKTYSLQGEVSITSPGSAWQAAG